MIGRTLGRFQISAKLGEGGMGVVYRAFDTRLNRTVALKVLQADALADSDRKQRFVQEAVAASALNHPHIVTTYDIDRIEEVEFIAMEFVEGRSLDRVIAAGQLPIAQVIEYGAQLADAVAAAHRAGIVHRDIKPANIMVTAGGQLKVLDFGLAKLAEPEAAPEAATITGVRGTAAGTVVGTAAYMAPEQAEGKRVTPASDVFAIGIVLYEMVAGARPFRGTTELSLLAALMRDDPPPLIAVRAGTPAAVEHIVSTCLQKDPAARYPSAAELSAAIEPLRHVPHAPRSNAWRMAAIAAIVLLAGGGAWWVVGGGRRTAVDDYRRALAEIDQLVDGQRTVAAYSRFRALQAARPDDPEIIARSQRLTWPSSLTTEPAGALIEVRDYVDLDSPWEQLGQTPLENISLPSGYLRMRVSKAGFEPIELGRSFAAEDAVHLHTAAARPAGMVYVPRGSQQFGGLVAIDLDAFWIDQYEVSNAEFKRFVDAGGYRRAELWTQPFVRDDKTVSFEEAVRTFVDATGRPGPSTWELGAFPEGKASEPVTGVSWYEAAAYAAFMGKLLPSVHHWHRAAGLDANAIFSEVVALSNFSGKGLAAAGEHQGVGPFGTYDQAGNAKEWCFNDTNGLRNMRGGSWSEPVYVFVDPYARSPFDRDAAFGFRTIKPAADGYAGYGAPEYAPILRLRRDPARETRADDAALATFARFYAYDKTALQPKIEKVETTAWWRKETVSYAAAYGGERIPAYLFLPANAAPPFQTVVHFPGAYARFFRTSGDRQLELHYVDFIIRSGRAVLFPIIKDTYERNLQAASGRNTARDRVVYWYKDLARSLDYLETRPDIDARSLAFHGLSMGANDAPIWGVLEPRLKTLIIVAGGLSLAERLPEVEPANYAPRVKVPVLMIGGRQDFMRPYEASQLALFRMLGTPEPDKRLASSDGGGHLPQRLPMIKEVLDWLDRYLGPVAIIPR